MVSNKRRQELVNRFSHKSDGLAAVEFVFISTLFFLMLFAVLDFVIVGYVKLTMQHAVREGARYAITGSVDLAPSNDSNRKAAVIKKMRNASHGFMDKTLDENGIRVTDAKGNALSGFGSPGETIVIHLDCKWPLLNPLARAVVSNGEYEFTVSATMRNEDFVGT